MFFLSSTLVVHAWLLWDWEDSDTHAVASTLRVNDLIKKKMDRKRSIFASWFPISVANMPALEPGTLRAQLCSHVIWMAIYVQ